MNDMLEMQKYEWFSRYRKDALDRLNKIRTIDETSNHRASRVSKIKSDIAKLEQKIKKLRQEELSICPHPNNNIVYDEIGNQDDYGCWTPYVNYRLSCNMCEKVLDKWDNDEELEKRRRGIIL